jgi:hypothetical protein
MKRQTRREAGAQNQGPPDGGSPVAKEAEVNLRRSALVALGTAALAVPAAAVAHPGNGKNHNVTYVFKGTYLGDGHVDVTHGNAHVRKNGLLGDVQFDLTSTKLNVADTNSDTLVDATDVLVDDKVIVKARLPKGDPGSNPFAARHLVDQTNPAPDDGDSEDADSEDSGDEA